MTETLLNGYLKIEPVEARTFMASQKDSYEEIGVVVARDEKLCADIPLNSKVFFDSFMAKKYPTEDNKWQWFVHRDEIVKCEHDN